MLTRSRPAGILLILALVTAACGGGEPSGSGEGATTTAATAPSPGDSGQTTTTRSPGDDEGSMAGANVATVIVAGTSYEFDMTPDAIRRCDPDFFGAFWGIGVGAGGTDLGLELLLPPEGDANFDDPPSIRVRDGINDLEWKADPGFWTYYPQGEGIPSQVDSWTIDGFSATGVATFIESNAAYAFVGGTADEPVPVQGTFEIVCAER